jgi:hypothetical protein
MIAREMLKQQIDSFPDDRLQQLADFMAFLQDRSSETDDTLKAEVLADFRQAWHEAMTGQGIPIEQLWAQLDHE